MDTEKTSQSHTRQEKLTALGKSIDPAYVDSKRICGQTRCAASQRLRGAHRISDLVVRTDEDGKLVLAAFIYYFNEYHITKRMIPRPTEWLVLDFVSGMPLKRVKCSDVDFTDAPMDQLYSLQLGKECDLSPDYYRSAYNILDEIRIEYMKNGKFDEKFYAKYLNAILQNTPEAYRRFFTDLTKSVKNSPTSIGSEMN